MRCGGSSAKTSLPALVRGEQRLQPEALVHDAPQSVAAPIPARHFGVPLHGELDWIVMKVSRKRPLPAL